MIMNITSAGELLKRKSPGTWSLFKFRKVILTWNGIFDDNFNYFTAGIISLLDEPMPELKVFALKKLDSIVDEFWPEISEVVEKM